MSILAKVLSAFARVTSSGACEASGFGVHLDPWSSQVAVYTGSSVPGLWSDWFEHLKLLSNLCSPNFQESCMEVHPFTQIHQMDVMIIKTVLDKSDSDFRGRQKLNFSQRLRGTNSFEASKRHRAVVWNMFQRPNGGRLKLWLRSH